MSALKECRICKRQNLKDVINLGHQYITSRFPKFGDFSTPKIEIGLCLCMDCGLLQLRETTNSSEMYEHEYGYRSGISNTMRKHLFDYKNEILKKETVTNNDIVMDIGSNDATMLKYYKDTGARLIGVDPTGKQFVSEYSMNQIELVQDYFTKDNVLKSLGIIPKCKVISSISMFYDIPDPVQFAKDIYSMLADDGMWTCEQSYMPSMLKTNSIDTICHEHLEYYSLEQILLISKMANLKIFDVVFNDCNGGSFRVYLCKAECQKFSEASDIISRIIQQEILMDLKNPETYYQFIRNCNIEIDKLTTFIKDLKSNGERIYVYGASTKGNCLLQYANLTSIDLPFAVERNLKKVGKMTSTGIEIISEDTMRKNPPEYLLVLPWHFKNEIIKREEDYLNNGGKIVFPFPKFKIITKQYLSILPFISAST